MTQPLNPAFAATEAPPVMEARRWLEGVTHPVERPLINVSQAAPVAIPPLGLREALADAALNNPDAHLYGPVLGLPALRAEIASQFSRAYGGQIDPTEVGITQGCNQAFCAVMATLAGAGDEVILPTPWYFNHKMWLDMTGVATVPLETDATLIPDAAKAEALITPKTRAIVLVTPNNPGGVEYPADVLDAFRDLARAHGLALIVDETYRDFDSRHSFEMGGRPHDLMTDPDWSDTVIQLYSFSKAYRLTGHRVGAIIGASDRLFQIEKFLDTVGRNPVPPSRAGRWFPCREGLEAFGLRCLFRLCGTPVRHGFRCAVQAAGQRSLAFVVARNDVPARRVRGREAPDPHRLCQCRCHGYCRSVAQAGGVPALTRAG